MRKLYLLYIIKECGDEMRLICIAYIEAEVIQDLFDYPY